jgi:hypothetical protein
MQHEGAVVKMAARLVTRIKEQRSAIRFLSSERVKPIEIHQYGDARLSRQHVY